MFSTEHCFEKCNQNDRSPLSLRDVMGQSYLICACTRTNDARYSSVHVAFCGSSEHRYKSNTREKTRQVESVEDIEQYQKICGNIALFKTWT